MNRGRSVFDSGPSSCSLNVQHDPGQRPELIPAGGRDGDDVAAAVVKSGALDEPAVRELVRGCRDVSAIDARTAAKGLRFES
jgi:hypothetical protein